VPRIEVSVERRLAAPHPGPIIKRDYVDVLGIELSALAAQLDLDQDRLEAMLAGRTSIDVNAAIRFARSLQLPAERIMQMQIRADFAASRATPDFGRVGILRRSAPFPFPESGFLRGRIGQTTEDASGNGSFFFQEDVEPNDGDDYAGLHALWRADLLRVYEPSGEVAWTGPVLQNLDGRTLLPFVSPADWHSWFATGRRADLAIGPDHAEFFARMRNV
jgi:addiction module HigA family antidote